MENRENVTNHIKAQNKNIAVLQKHFAHCFDKNGAFDVEKFKQELAENEIDFYKESYGLDWLGKSYARLLASDEATTLLKEDASFNQKEENKKSGHLLLKGDNLEVLKHLSHAYYEKVKMIYIDPPYNTGSDGFVYQDDRKFSVKELQELAGVDEDKAKRILSFTQSKSNSHSAWLTFMYPRLYIAKHLLREDGVIFVSIDDNEVAQLRILMDEIFGEENFVAELGVQLNPRGRNLDKFIAKTHEYILIYTSKPEVPDSMKGLEKKGDMVKAYNRDDNDDKGAYRLIGLRNRNQSFNPTTRPNLYYPLFINPQNGKVSLKEDEKYSIKVLPDTKDGIQTCWTWGKEKIRKENELLFAEKSNDSYRVYRKDYFFDKDGNAAKSLPKSLWLDKGVNNDFGKRRIKQLFVVNIMSFPKSTFLIKKIIKFAANPSDLILDFFAGSGTTGDAVMQLNAEDGGHRKYILVQLPEAIDPKKSKAAYKFVKEELGKDKPTIFEITKERLIRAAQKIKEETILPKIAEKEKELKALKEKLKLPGHEAKMNALEEEIRQLQQQDLGFRVFETQPIWEDYHFDAEELNPQTRLFDELQLTAEDLKALLTTWKTYDGIPLTEALQPIDLGDYMSHYALRKLYLMEKGFNTQHLKALLEKIDTDKDFAPASIIAFGYHFESKSLRELAENVKNYSNKKNMDIDFITRY